MATLINTATSASDEAPIIDVIVGAFSADPVAHWLWPDPQQYLMHSASFARAFGGRAFAHRNAYYIDGYAGAALWLPPNVHPDEEALIAVLQSTVISTKLQLSKDKFFLDQPLRLILVNLFPIRQQLKVDLAAVQQQDYLTEVLAAQSHGLKNI
jgi:hypothetical protein